MGGKDELGVRIKSVYFKSKEEERICKEILKIVRFSQASRDRVLSLIDSFQ